MFGDGLQRRHVNTRSKVMLIAALLAAAAVIPAIAYGGSSNDDRVEQERPIESSELEQASRVAIDHLGGGVVTETEVGDEESYYEVEVTIDGQQFDVQLDEDFNVVSSEDDGVDDD